MPAAELVSRVRRLAHLELAGQADERLNGLVLGLLLLFSWTVCLFTVLVARLVRGESLLAGPTGSTLSLTYFAVAWISGAGLLVLLGIYVRKERRLA
jgi:hypothetical protein